MANFFIQIWTSISKILFGSDYYNVLRNDLYKLLLVWNPDFVSSYPYGLINFLCGIIVMGYVYLLIRVIQQLIGIISKIIGGLF